MDQTTPDRLRTAGYSLDTLRQLETSRFLTRVYGWMTGGLAVTGLVSAFMVSNPTLISQLVRTPFLFYGMLIGELVLVGALAGWVQRMSALQATGTFLFYSALNGVTLSVIFLLYTRASIASTFLVTAATFGAMTAYGAATDRDLTSVGSFCFMGLVGVIIASVVNLFMHSAAIYWVTTYAGILVFIGLTAYDTQRIKSLNVPGNEGTDDDRKEAISGALILYLDFINLFLMLLRLFGRRND